MMFFYGAKRLRLTGMISALVRFYQINGHRFMIKNSISYILPLRKKKAGINEQRTKSSHLSYGS